MSRNSSGSWGGVLKVSVVQRLEAGRVCGALWSSMAGAQSREREVGP